VSIAYNYNRQIEPPAPLISVTVSCPEDADLFMSAPALLDTGADYSVITDTICKKLMLLPIGEVYVESFRGEGDVHQIYPVNFKIHEWRFTQIPVLVGTEHYVILGRDILNHFDLRLNGIEQKFELIRGPEL